MWNLKFIELCETSSKVQCLVVYLIGQRTLYAAHVEIACVIRIQHENWIGIDSTHYRSQSVWSRRAHLTDLNTGKPRSKVCIAQSTTRGKGAERRKIPQVRSTQVYWTGFWKKSEVSRITRSTWVDRRRMCRVRRIGSGRPYVHTHNWRISTPCIELENSTEQFRTKWTDGQKIRLSESSPTKEPTTPRIRKNPWRAHPFRRARSNKSLQPVLSDMSKQCSYGQENRMEVISFIFLILILETLWQVVGLAQVEQLKWAMNSGLPHFQFLCFA